MFSNQDILGLLLYNVLYIVICDTILSPSSTVWCPGATESIVCDLQLARYELTLNAHPCIWVWIALPWYSNVFG